MPCRGMRTQAGELEGRGGRPSEPVTFRLPPVPCYPGGRHTRPLIDLGRVDPRSDTLVSIDIKVLDNSRVGGLEVGACRDT